MKLFKKWKAKRLCVPFFIKEHWQPYWGTFNSDGRLMNDKFIVLIFDNDLNSGIVNLLVDGNKIHRYRIVKTSRAPGSDWGWHTNKQFDLEYSNTISNHSTTKP
jgi:hypothetical protein